MARNNTTPTPEDVAVAEKAAKEKAELEAKELAEKEAAEKAELEAKKLAEKEAVEKAELEAKELAEKEAAEKAALEKSKKQDKQSPAEKLVDSYRKSYPDNKVFYVTSDMQVFLHIDQNMAILHQKTLKNGELEIVKF